MLPLDNQLRRSYHADRVAALRAAAARPAGLPYHARIPIRRSVGRSLITLGVRLAGDAPLEVRLEPSRPA